MPMTEHHTPRDHLQDPQQVPMPDHMQVQPQQVSAYQETSRVNYMGATAIHWQDRGKQRDN